MFRPDASPSSARAAVPRESAGLPALEDLAVGEQVGAFVGILRRPKASGEGLTVQIFGENGEDADIITALHLTRYLDAPVHVALWMLKDGTGRLMKKSGEYPKIADFIAKVRRPSASNSGQVAQFFAENGPNADAVCVLNQTSYLDAMIHVEIRKAALDTVPGVIVAPDDLAALDADAQRQTPAEMRILKGQQKRAAEGLRLLKTTGFFYNQGVAAALGNLMDYSGWMVHQGCCQPGAQPCLDGPVEAFAIPGRGGREFIPLCRTHAQAWAAGNHGLGTDPMGFMNSRHLAYFQRWTEERLRMALNVPTGYDPMPSAVYRWSVDHKIQHLLTPAYLALMSDT